MIWNKCLKTNLLLTENAQIQLVLQSFFHTGHLQLQHYSILLGNTAGLIVRIHLTTSVCYYSAEHFENLRKQHLSVITQLNCLKNYVNFKKIALVIISIYFH